MDNYIEKQTTTYKIILLICYLMKIAFRKIT